MKPSLHLKVIAVLGYVVLCTMLVLGGHQSDGPAREGMAPAALDHE
ncbi:MAG: hypothetical protein JWP34_3650 [Massilia sp.]|nr:hypothetical protein [Massilia sp.]MDB5909536.1 hypothetical protein [Massilia sp.]